MSVAAAAREQSDVLTQLNELWRSIEQEIRTHRYEQERTRTVLQEQLERVQSQAPDKLAAETVAEPDYKRVSDEVIRNQQNQIQLIKEVRFGGLLASPLPGRNINAYTKLRVLKSRFPFFLPVPSPLPTPSVPTISHLRKICKKLNKPQEKDTFEKLWQSSQRTIRILELEIHEYRRQLKQPKGILEVRQQYMAAVQLLEQNLTGVRASLDEKIAENRHLQNEERTAKERMQELEEELKGKQQQQQQPESVTSM